MKKLMLSSILVLNEFKNKLRPLSFIFLFALVPSGIFAQASFDIYGFRGNNNTDFWRYSIDSNSWLTTAANSSTAIALPPAGISNGGSLTTDGDYIYALRGGGNNNFYRYDVITNTWSAMAVAPATVSSGGSLVHLGNYIYAFRGNGTTDFYRYDITSNSWSTLTNTPAIVGEGGALTTDGTFIYGLRGDSSTSFYRYDIGGNTWTTLASPANTAQKGAALTFHNGFIYALLGNSRNVSRYNISTGTWVALPQTPNDIKEGGAITVVGNNLYILRGGDQKNFLSYDITSGTTGTWTQNAQTPENVKWGGALSTFRILNSDLQMVKTLSSPASGTSFDPGETLTYTLTVTNNGADPANEVQAVDQLPDEVTFVSATGDGTYNSLTGIWTIGVLGDTQSATIDIVVTVNSASTTAGKTVVNSATVSAFTADNNLTNNTDDATFQVNGADLEITKVGTSLDDPIVESSDITYVITLTNNGPNVANTVEVTEALPNEVTENSSTPSQGTYTSATGLWDVGTLNVGQTVTLTIETSVVSGGSITNTAVITNSDQNDSNTDNNTATNVLSVLKTFQAGACIINLGLTNSYDAALKPYGLVFDLVRNYNVPVWWAINPQKSFGSETTKTDDIDFTIDGVAYRGGAFIISQEFASQPLVQGIIAGWVTDYPDLQVNCSQPEFAVPIHDRITSLPNAVLDEENGDKAIDAFFAQNRSGIAQFLADSDPNNDAYRIGTPLSLTSCDDIYIMPHADPSAWDTATKTAFENFIDEEGWLWAACHAIGDLEGIYTWTDNGTPRTGYNLLTVNGMLNYNSHADATPPFSYSLHSGEFYNNLASDPFMQFIGEVDGALTGGSQNALVPLADGWRTTTTVALWDPNHPDAPAPATYPDYVTAVVAYGKAFGDPSLGMVMYQGSHTFANGSIAENIGSAKMLGNFWFEAGAALTPNIETVISGGDAALCPGDTDDFEVTATTATGTTIASTTWTSSCGGSFSDDTAQATTFTPPIVNEETTCNITVTVIDTCGRETIETFPITLIPTLHADVNATYVNTAIAGDMSTNNPALIDKTFNDIVADPGNPTTDLPTLLADGSYSFVSGTPGVYNFDVILNDPSFPTIGSCLTDKLTITILDFFVTNDPPVTAPDYAVMYGDGTTPSTITLDVRTNDMIGNEGGTLDTPTIAAAPLASEGTATINASGDIEFTPTAGFYGEVEFTYQVCESPSVECRIETVFITVLPSTTETRVVGSDDYNQTDNDLTVSVTSPSEGVLANDHTTSASALAASIAGGTTTANPGETELVQAGVGTLTMQSDGTYTYVPDVTFVGTAVFPYELCDGTSCAQATLYIIVTEACFELNLRVYLAGALINNGAATGTGGEPLMRDNLRNSIFEASTSYLPTLEPYTALAGFTHVGSGGDETATASAFDERGQNSVVDWVFIEFRDKTDNTSVLETRAALVQRDGDIVGVDGVTPIELCTAETEYFVAVRHRNHLGVMTALAEDLKVDNTVDFSDNNAGGSGVFNYGTSHPQGGPAGFDYTGLSQRSLSGVSALWLGNPSGDNKVKFTAPFDDTAVISNNVVFHPANNISFSAAFDFAFGYYRGDINMNGKVKYTAPGDDTSLISNQIVFYPLNSPFFSAAFDFFFEQIPQ